MNLVAMLHVTQMNPLQTKHVQGRFVPPKTDNMAAQPQQSSSEEGSKENTILNGPRHDRERSAQGCPSGSTDDRPQGPALQHPQHKLEDHHRLTQSPIQAETTRIYWNTMTPMDPPEHLQMAKAQELLNQRRHQNLTLGLQQVQVLLLSLLTHQRTLLYVLDVVKVATGAGIVHIIISVIFCRVTTHSTHMCRANKHGPGSPVCVYCGKTNHSSAYCRLQGLGTTGKNLDTHQTH